MLVKDTRFSTRFVHQHQQQRRWRWWPARVLVVRARERGPLWMPVRIHAIPHRKYRPKMNNKWAPKWAPNWATNETQMSNRWVTSESKMNKTWATDEPKNEPKNHMVTHRLTACDAVGVCGYEIHHFARAPQFSPPWSCSGGCVSCGSWPRCCYTLSHNDNLSCRRVHGVHARLCGGTPSRLSWNRSLHARRNRSLLK